MDDAPPGGEETGDDVVGFDRNRMFTKANALSETEIERLLANTPWNTRGWASGVAQDALGPLTVTPRRRGLPM